MIFIECIQFDGNSKRERLLLIFRINAHIINDNDIFEEFDIFQRIS